MRIVEIATGLRKSVIITAVGAEDFNILTKKRFSFTWKSFRNSTTIYKLQLEDEDHILGVIGLIDWPAEKRIEIKLLACSAENIGKQKIYEGIAGCLIAFACRLAVSRYGPLEGRNLIKILEKYYEN